MLKDGASIYRVVIDRPARSGPSPAPGRQEIFGPYGTKGAAKGKLTSETLGYFGDGVGSVQVIENPQWKEAK